MLPDFLLPYSEVDTKNPLFLQKWHHLRWLNSEANLRRYTYLTLIGLPLIAVAVWLLERLNLNFADVSSDFANRLINLVVYAAFIVMILASLYAIPRIMGRFNAQFNSAYWDTLRLTPQYNSAILMSHDAIAQLRLWLFTALEIGLRIAILILYTLNNFYAVYHSSAQQPFLQRTLLNPLCLGVWSIIALIGLLFALEPIFRARLIVAFLLTIAIRVRNVPLALLLAFTALALIHLTQIFLVVTLYAIFQAFTKTEMGGVGLVVCFLPMAASSAALLWVLYRRLRRTALDLVYDSAFRQD